MKYKHGEGVHKMDNEKNLLNLQTRKRYIPRRRHQVQIDKENEEDWHG